MTRSSTAKLVDDPAMNTFSATLGQLVRNGWMTERRGELVGMLDVLDWESRKRAVRTVFEEMESIGYARDEFIASFADDLDKYDPKLSEIYCRKKEWKVMVEGSRTEAQKRVANNTIKDIWAGILGNEWWTPLRCSKPGGYGSWDMARQYARAWEKRYESINSVYYWLDKAFTKHNNRIRPTPEKPAHYEWSFFLTAKRLMLANDTREFRRLANKYDFHRMNDVTVRSKHQETVSGGKGTGKKGRDAGGRSGAAERGRGKGTAKSGEGSGGAFNR
jgi:hypothetical protein